MAMYSVQLQTKVVQRGYDPKDYRIQISATAFKISDNGDLIFDFYGTNITAIAAGEWHSVFPIPKEED